MCELAVCSTAGRAGLDSVPFVWLQDSAEHCMCDRLLSFLFFLKLSVSSHLKHLGSVSVPEHAVTLFSVKILGKGCCHCHSVDEKPET